MIGHAQASTVSAYDFERIGDEAKRYSLTISSEVTMPKDKKDPSKG
eukprot:COSAG01_NODE_62663_length_283_cov_1.217391_2_plen_45_part_01